MSEVTEFHRHAASAIYIRGILIAKLGLDPDTATDKEILAELASRLALAREAEAQSREIKRLKHDVDTITTTLNAKTEEIARLKGEPVTL